MILVVLVAACVVSVWPAGGRLRRLAELPVRGLWIAPVALALQVLITTIVPGGSRPLHVALHILSYALIGLFLLVNRRIAGVGVIAVGAGMNALAIVVNGGVMPTAAAAERLAGLTAGRGFHNSAVIAHPVLLWLGDIIPVPGPLPDVLSIGDCVIFAGVLLLLHRTCTATVRVDAQRLTTPALSVTRTRKS